MPLRVLIAVHSSMHAVLFERLMHPRVCVSMAQAEHFDSKLRSLGSPILYLILSQKILHLQVRPHDLPLIHPRYTLR